MENCPSCGSLRIIEETDEYDGSGDTSGRNKCLDCDEMWDEREDIDSENGVIEYTRSFRINPEKYYR